MQEESKSFSTGYDTVTRNDHFQIAKKLFEEMGGTKAKDPKKIQNFKGPGLVLYLKTFFSSSNKKGYGVFLLQLESVKSGHSKLVLSFFLKQNNVKELPPNVPKFTMAVIYGNGNTHPLASVSSFKGRFKVHTKNVADCF